MCLRYGHPFKLFARNVPKAVRIIKHIIVLQVVVDHFLFVNDRKRSDIKCGTLIVVMLFIVVNSIAFLLDIFTSVDGFVQSMPCHDYLTRCKIQS